MTQDKTNHSVLTTVSFTLLVLIAVPNSACPHTSMANSRASTLLCLSPLPPVLGPLLLVCLLLQLFSAVPNFPPQPHTPYCQASPFTTLSIKANVCCTALSSEES